MPSADQCPRSGQPHEPHRVHLGPWGVLDCPGVPVPVDEQPAAELDLADATEARALLASGLEARGIEVPHLAGPKALAEIALACLDADDQATAALRADLAEARTMRGAHAPAGSAHGPDGAAHSPRASDLRTAILHAVSPHVRDGGCRVDDVCVLCRWAEERTDAVMAAVADHIRQLVIPRSHADPPGRQ
ncbi:hypothetical protein ACFHW1_05080 [Micromonospora sp. LOL_014]|uniref:hypothetical protein n=1 Tax=Micromonospora sp. LOL_014 TaxID=3345415 RepID=UPI003A856396